MLATNNETMTARIEIVGAGGKTSKIKLSAADIRRLYEAKSSGKEGYHLTCSREKWEEKRERRKRERKSKVSEIDMRRRRKKRRARRK